MGITTGQLWNWGAPWIDDLFAGTKIGRKWDIANRMAMHPWRLGATAALGFGAYHEVHSWFNMTGPGYLNQQLLVGDPHIRAKILNGRLGLDGYVDHQAPGMNPWADQTDALYQGGGYPSANYSYGQAAVAAQRAASAYGTAPGSLVFGLYNSRLK